jgi:hypothetical protein
MSLFDFDKLKRPETGKRPIKPIEIFRTAPTLDQTPNDLWQGQSKALEQWHENRTTTDISISLHTGAGKSLVGLIICQSLINEGLGKVLYLCPTTDLVTQISREARAKLGFEHTIRVRQEWSNNFYDTGRAFCISTYQALLNSHSVFSQDRRPQAIVFDDAHVAEKIIRDNFTLTIRQRKEADLFQHLAELLQPHFDAVGRHDYYQNALRGDSAYRVIQAPPGAIVALHREFMEAFHRTGYAKRQTFVFGHLADQLAKCSVFVSQGAIEISPAFLPARRIPIFSDSQVRRVYLSATLTSEVDFCRAFGKRPSLRIEPESDAGTGERLILPLDKSRLKSAGKTGADDLVVASQLARGNKLLITTASYPAAEKYKSLALPPRPERFTEELDAFKSAKAGVFVLVARVDGIDLPQATCRVTLADGLPTGFSAYERYLFEHLDMRNSFAAKIANRITQLFGRTNRGRNDYSVIFVTESRFVSWLLSGKNLALLPELLRKQVLLGSSLSTQFKIENVEQLPELVAQVINRDTGWLRYYADSISGLNVSEEDRSRSKETDEMILAASLAEAEFVAKMWDGDYAGAREVLGPISDQIVSADRKLGGWYNINLGHTYELEGDSEAAAKQYSQARSRLLVVLALPNPETKASIARGQEVINEVHERLLFIFNNDVKVQNDRIAQYDRLIKRLEDNNSSASVHEEAVRALGEILGFEASRPEQEVGTGPDVVWKSNAKKQVLSFELKTKKKAANKINKDDIGQGHDHIQWVADNCQGYEHLGLVFVSDAKDLTEVANPAAAMWLTLPARLMEQYAVYVALLRAIQRMAPLDRYAEIAQAAEREDWSLRTVFDKLKVKRLVE